MMHRIFFLIVFLTFAGISAQAQTVSTLSKKEQRKLLKEEKKRLEAEELAKSAKLMEYMVEHAVFVLEADMLSDKYGNNNNVSSMLNFVLADSVFGIIQIGNPYYLGQNGVGGVTVEGKISDYKYEKNDKRKSFSVSYNVRSTFGTYHVHLDIGFSGRADATVSGTFSGSIRYSGKLVHPQTSRVYKGNSL